MTTGERPEPKKIPVYEGHPDPALLAKFARLFAHAERLKGMLPSTRVLLQLHGNLLQSGVKSKEEITSQKV